MKVQRPNHCATREFPEQAFLKTGDQLDDLQVSLPPMILPTSPSQTAKRKCPAGLECGTNSGSDLVKWDLPTNTGPIPLCSQTWPLYSSLMLVLHLSPWQCLCPQGLTWTMSSACSLNKQDATLDLVSPPLNACHHPHPPPLPLWPGSHPHPSVVRIPFALGKFAVGKFSAEKWHQDQYMFLLQSGKSKAWTSQEQFQ